MRTILVAGHFHRLLTEYGLDIVNKEPLSLEDVVPFLQQTQLMFEQIVVTDEGMTGCDEYAVKSALTGLMLLQERENKIRPVIVVTNKALFSDFRQQGVSVEKSAHIRVPIQKYLDAVAGAHTQAAPKPARSKPVKEESAQPAPARTSLLDRLRKEKAAKVPEPAADRDFEAISREISRVVAVTGCRGSGVTSTAVNLAQIANTRNISTILVDLDTVNCALNLYFNEYYEMADNNEDVACSLIRNLAKPQDYNHNSYRSRNLYVVTLAYSFHDKSLLERFYTPARLINMLSVFRKHFQLCLLDMPLEVLAGFKESLLYIDVFGLCVPNNLYALTSTLRGVQDAFDKEESELLFGKSKIVVSKYNDQASLQDEFFSADKVCQLLLELSEAEGDRQFELAGHIPYSMVFDNQLETDIPVSQSDSHMEKAYSDILLRLFKGAR